MYHPGKKSLYNFRRMYEANISLLVRFAGRYVPLEIAEDIVQDVFLEIWKKDKVNEISGISYLLTAVRNRCLNYLKQEQIKSVYMQQVTSEARELEKDHSAPIEKSMMEKEQLQQIYDQIEQLPDKCRNIFKMAYFEEKKSAEIAGLLNLSIRTVEHQLYLALKTLRARLQKKQQKIIKNFIFF